MIKRFFHILSVIYRRVTSVIIIENTFLLKRKKVIRQLQQLHDKYLIRIVDVNDLNELQKYSSYRKDTFYQEHLLPRIKSDKWIGLAAIDTTNNEIAYLSWIATKNVGFIDEIDIFLTKNQYFLKDSYCVPKYRRQNIHQRMMQERINYCIRNGADEIFINILNANKKGVENVEDFGFQLYQANYLINLQEKRNIYSKNY